MGDVNTVRHRGKQVSKVYEDSFRCRRDGPGPLRSDGLCAHTPLFVYVCVRRALVRVRPCGSHHPFVPDGPDPLPGMGPSVRVGCDPGVVKEVRVVNVWPAYSVESRVSECLRRFYRAGG